MTKEYAKSLYSESLRLVRAGYWHCFPLSEISVMSRGLPPYRLSSGDYGLNLGGNAESLRPMYMGEDSFFISLLLWEKGDRLRWMRSQLHLVESSIFVKKLTYTSSVSYAATFSHRRRLKQ